MTPAPSITRPHVRHNRALIGLTNRTGPFSWSALNRHVPNFQQTPISPEAASVRHRMGLDRTDTDWVVILSLNLLVAYPDLYAMIEEQDLTYDLNQFSHVPFSSTGGSLVTSETAGPPYILIHPDRWPIDNSFSITRQDDQHASLRMPGGEILTVRARPYPTGVLVEWPERDHFRVNGLLAPDDWEGDGIVTIQYWPAGPVPGLLDRVLQGAVDLPELLRQVGMAETYLLCGHETERWACACVALVRQNPLLF